MGNQHKCIYKTALNALKEFILVASIYSPNTQTDNSQTNNSGKEEEVVYKKEDIIQANIQFINVPLRKELGYTQEEKGEGITCSLHHLELKKDGGEEGEKGERWYHGQVALKNAQGNCILNKQITHQISFILSTKATI
jgi:hypothetical protein